MIIHGENIKLNDENLPLERACTVTIAEDTTKTTGASRGVTHRPALRSWKVEAQFLFRWETVARLCNLMSSGQKTHVVITGRAPLKATFTFSGDAYVTRCGVPAQGRGLVTIAVTFQGCGKPDYDSVIEYHDFTLGTSRLGTYADITQQPLI